MATNKEEVKEIDNKKVVYSIYQKLLFMRQDYLKKSVDIKKTGYNKYSNFNYYELGDFLAICTDIASNHKIVIIYSLDEKNAYLTLIDTENNNEKLVFSMPLAEATVKGANAIQNLGSLKTYTKKYLYFDVFEIAESDEFEPSTGSPDVKKENAAAEQKKAEEEAEKIRAEKIAPVKVKTLKDTLLETGISEAAVLKKYAVASLEDLTEGDYPKVLKDIEITIKRA